MQGKSVQYVYPGYGYLIRWFLKGLTSNQIVLNCVPENWSYASVEQMPWTDQSGETAEDQEYIISAQNL